MFYCDSSGYQAVIKQPSNLVYLKICFIPFVNFDLHSRSNPMVEVVMYLFSSTGILEACLMSSHHMWQIQSTGRVMYELPAYCRMKTFLNLKKHYIVPDVKRASFTVVCIVYYLFLLGTQPF